MKRARFGRRKMMASVAALVLILSATLFESSGATGPDLNNEVRTLSTYFDDLTAFQRECAELERKAALEHIHINPLQVKADDLKSRLPGVQTAVGEIIRKLKAANLWDGLDTATVTNSIVHTEPWGRTIQQESFKRLLENAAANLSSHKNEITVPVDNLRKRIAGRTQLYRDDVFAIVPAAYPPQAPAPSQSLSCTVGKNLIRVAEQVGHAVANRTTLTKVGCACGQVSACR